MNESVTSPTSNFTFFLLHLQDAEHFEEPDKEEKQKDVQSYEVKVMHFLALVLGRLTLSYRLILRSYLARI